MKCSEGDEKMVKIASSIRAGANAYLKQQYSTVAKVFAVVFVILLIIAFASKVCLSLLKVSFPGIILTLFAVQQ